MSSLRKSAKPRVLTGPQSIAIEAVIQGATYTEAAERAGCTNETMRLWMRPDHPVRQEVEAIRAERLATSRSALADLIPEAVEELALIIRDPEVHPGTKLAAVREIFDRAGLPKEERRRTEISGELKHSAAIDDFSGMADTDIVTELQVIEGGTG